MNIYFRFITLIIIILNITLITSCSILQQYVYHPDINQGNFFSITDMNKIRKGMNKQQVIYLLGTPMLKSSFHKQVWYYIFRQQLSHGYINQKIFKFIFNKNILIDIQKIN